MARMVGKAPLDLKITNGKQTLGSWSWNWKSNRIESQSQKRRLCGASLSMVSLAMSIEWGFLMLAIE